MKHYPPRIDARPSRPCAIPPFHAVPGKARGDGWTPLRQAEFIGHLAETRSVSTAARRVGMARETAYRLRRRKWSAGICAAWDAAMGRPPRGKPAPLSPKEARHRAMLAATGWNSWVGLPARRARRPDAESEAEAETKSGTPPPAKVTLAELQWRYSTGIWQIIMRQGRYCGVRRKADDSALLQAIGRLGITSRRGVQHGLPASTPPQRSQF